MHPVHAFFEQFEWIHTGLGLLGNLAFLIGSVLFLYEDLMRAGAILFIVGAGGMFVGSLGSAIVKLAKE